MRIWTFDTTLRDGTQGEAVSFTVEDKLLITQKLDELGIDYIEGGWPGSNPKDKEFFDKATATNSKDDPEGFCLPPGVPRMMYTPYPAQIFQLNDRIVFIFEGGAHVHRTIFMDGRKHSADPNPTYLGESFGHWERSWPGQPPGPSFAGQSRPCQISP